MSRKTRTPKDKLVVKLKETMSTLRRPNPRHKLDVALAPAAFATRSSVPSQSRQLLQQIRSPFTTTSTVRGPYCGQPTGLFSLRQRTTISVAAGYVAVIIAQPNFYGGFHWICATNLPGNVPSTTHFNTLGVWPSAGTANNLYPESRVVGGGLRVVNTTQTLNVGGEITAGFLPADTFTAGGTGAVSLPATYADLVNLPILAATVPGAPVEVVHSLGASGGYNIDEFTGLGIPTTIANIINGTQPTGFCCIAINNSTANPITFAVEVVFHLEGIPNQAYLNFVPLSISRMTFSEFERVMIDESERMPITRARTGQAALDDCDTMCQIGRAGSSVMSALKNGAQSLLENETVREVTGQGVQALATTVAAAGRSYMARRHNHRLLLK